MNEPTQKPVIFLAFAQDRVEGGAYLRNLPIELDGIRKALQKARQAGLCEVVERSNTTVENILDVFQEYQDRIAVFHYGGHADSYELLLESLTGEHAMAHSEGLVSFLAKQKGLQLVFLNGCCSQQQALDLIEAGVPAVVGTSQKIDDEVATNLSERFYKGLAVGLAIHRAWAEAVDQVKVEKGTANLRALHWKGKVEATDRFPWEIYYRKGAEVVKEWNLPAAANQPLFGLPLPEDYYRKLPAAPFVWLQDFKKEDAAIFFGRGAEIRKLYTQIITGMQPIILFYGKAGVGKSSLLQAGLTPRIENDYTVKYIRQPPAKELTRTLTQALQELGDEYGLPPVEPTGKNDLHAKIDALQKALDESTGFARQVLESELQKLTALAGETLTFLAHWRRIEEKTGRPLIIMLDQAEENFTHHKRDGGEAAGELKNFLKTVRNIFEQKEMRPRGKLILGYREEYHRLLCEAFQAFSLPFAETFLPPLSWDGIIEAVEGVTLHPSTQNQYHLEIERSKGSNLPEIIADDLLEGEESPIAPMLQILLTELWEIAVKENPKAPRFTVRQYQELKQAGAILSEFFKQQMTQLQEWQKNVVESGLILDLLYRHTTPAGSAESLSGEKLRDIYQDRQATIEQLLGRCRDFYLLTDVQLRGTSLAHHLLAPVIIKEYSNSVKPGQQAARILNSKIEEFRANEKNIWLNDSDLEIVEKGKEGIRRLNADEEKLLQISRERKAQRERERKRNRIIRNVLVAVIFAFAILAGWQWQVSERNYKQAKANQLAFIAKDAFKTDNTNALRIAQAAYTILAANSPAAVTRTLSEVFHSQDLRPFYAANFPHSKHVTSAVFSPDGRQILTASEDGFAKLWDQRGQLLRAFNHHDYEVKSAVFSPNGKQILTLANDIVRLWDMNGRLVDSDTLHTEPMADLSDFSTDGMRILTVFAGSEDEKYRALIRRLKQENTDAKLAPNKKRILIISHDENVRLCDGEGKTLKDGVASNAVSTDFSPDGKRFLVVSVLHDTLSIISFWDENGNFLGDFKYKDWVTTAVFSPDGRQILTAAKDRTAKLWDFSEKFIHRLPQHGLAVKAVDVSPDGKRMVAALFDGFVRLWDMRGNLLDSLKHDGAVNSAIFSPDGKRILSASRDGTARLWMPEEAQVIKLQHRAEVETAVFSPDGSRILTASLDSTVRVWTANGAPVDTLHHHGEVIAAAFSFDGRKILTASSDSAATLWAANGALMRIIKHRDEIYAAVFSPDGKRILAAGADGTARLWAANGDSVRTFKHKNRVKIAVFSPDGRRILTASDVVKLWDEQGKLLDSLAHKSGVNSAIFSADGKQILTASGDHSAKLWNLKGELLANYGKHELKVNSALFSPDGKKIITASDDGYAIIWLTPGAIDDWLKTAPVYRLTPTEEELYEIVR
ncbi:AAA family ATPase [candidate division KSB1 bacterium]|nr:AAA family ATPase [candidate division KSB1 bacterium]